MARGWAATIAAGLALAFGTAPLQAAVYTVGNPVGAGACSCGTLQCAFDVARSNPGADEVRITRTLTYNDTNAAIEVRTGDTLLVTGAYATCTQAAPDTAFTELSGAGGAAEPVLRITVQSGASALLRQLRLTGGDHTRNPPQVGLGGAIHLTGAGVLTLEDSIISNNRADAGGGIAAVGSSFSAGLHLGRNVQVSNNTARYNGGGIALDGFDLEMLVAGSVIAFNTAEGVLAGTGYGGGLVVSGGTRYTEATIGAGQGSLGALYGNQAKYGGGAAMLAGDIDGGGAGLKVANTDLAQPAAVISNFASVRGGGVYMRAGPDSSFGEPQAASATITGGAYFRDNAAPAGAAAYADAQDGRGGFFRMSGGSIRANTASDENGMPTDGAIVQVDPMPTNGNSDNLSLSNVVLHENNGGPLLRHGGEARLDQLLVVGNTSRGRLLQAVGGSGHTRIYRSTIADNTITANEVFDSSKEFLLRGSIVHQPGKVTLRQTGGTRLAEYVVASEVASLTDFITGLVQLADPLFVDPAVGDYQLQAASPAIDFAPASGGTDLANAPRSVDLAVVSDQGEGWITDLGAYERQGLLPLVRNANFGAARMALWSAGSAGIWVSDSAQNDGTGAVYVRQTAAPGGRALGPTQCVRLPGPGNYSLSGWGKEPSSSMADADYPRLEWRLFPNSGTCQGSPSAVGGIALPSGNGWAQLAVPTSFEMPAAQFAGNAAVEIALVAVDFNASGTNLVDAYFDAIVLDYAGSGNLAPVVTTQLLNRSDAEGATVSQATAPNFSDPNGDVLTYSASGLPPGLAISPVTGVVDGTLGFDSAGSYTVLVRATDPGGASVAQAFAWEVSDTPQGDALFQDGFE